MKDFLDLLCSTCSNWKCCMLSQQLIHCLNPLEMQKPYETSTVVGLESMLKFTLMKRYVIATILCTVFICGTIFFISLFVSSVCMLNNSNS